MLKLGGDEEKTLMEIAQGTNIVILILCLVPAVLYGISMLICILSPGWKTAAAMAGTIAVGLPLMVYIAHNIIYFVLAMLFALLICFLVATSFDDFGIVAFAFFEEAFPVLIAVIFFIVVIAIFSGFTESLTFF